MEAPSLHTAVYENEELMAKILIAKMNENNVPGAFTLRFAATSICSPMGGAVELASKVNLI